MHGKLNDSSLMCALLYSVYVYIYIYILCCISVVCLEYRIELNSNTSQENFAMISGSAIYSTQSVN